MAHKAKAIEYVAWWTSRWTSFPELDRLMDRLLPDWKLRRESLNRLPVQHVDWEY